MKTFNTFVELALARITTGTPVRILKPSLIDGIVENEGEGLSLVSGNVFIPQFDDQEALTGRKISLLDDSFESGFNAYINVYKKNDDGEWESSNEGHTSTIYYNGQLWWPLLDIPYLEGGYQITSWSQPTLNPDILEVSVQGGSVIQFNRFVGVNPSISEIDSFTSDVFDINTSAVIPGGSLEWDISREGNLIVLQVKFVADGGVVSMDAGSSPGLVPAWAIPIADTKQSGHIDVSDGTIGQISIDTSGLVKLDRISVDNLVEYVDLGNTDMYFNISYIGATI